MPFNDGIEKVHSYSLGDFHDFDYCPFRFFVKHHLQQKYELEEGSFPMAVGTILDQAIKHFHLSKAYTQPTSYLKNIIARAVVMIRDDAASKKGKSFYSAMLPFINDESIALATKIFENYHRSRGGKIPQSLGKVGFCEWVINDGEISYKLWGGPDTYEAGEDGLPLICDYKYFEDNEKGKQNLDMDLMPKIYTLLSANYLREKGYKKARFIIKLWQDPQDETLFEEFDLDKLEAFELTFKQKIQKILATKQLQFCEKPFCKVCKSEKRSQYMQDLKQRYNMVVPDEVTVSEEPNQELDDLFASV